MILTHRQVAAGDRMPRGYGRAWTDLSRDRIVAYPMPFNWLVGWARRAWFRVMRGPYQNELEILRERDDLNRRTEARLWERLAAERAQAERAIRTLDADARKWRWCVGYFFAGWGWSPRS